MLRILLGGVAVFAVLLALWGFGSNILVDWYDRNAPRDEMTKVMRGAEARELGPADSPNAALFIHGFAGSGNNFADLPERLAAAGWYVQVMRLPGHGTSPRDLERTDSDQLEKAVEQAAAGLRNDHRTVVLIGHSMGGALATIAASKGNADAVVLAAPYFGVTHRWYYGLRPETWENIAAPVVRWIYKGKTFRQINRKENNEKIVDYAMWPMKSVVDLHKVAEEASSTSTLKRITVPVLMFQSKTDLAASPEAAEKAFNTMPSEDKTLVWLKNTNHHVFWDYDQEQVEKQTLEFLNRVAAAHNS